MTAWPKWARAYRFAGSGAILAASTCHHAIIYYALARSHKHGVHTREDSSARRNVRHNVTYSTYLGACQELVIN